MIYANLVTKINNKSKKDFSFYKKSELHFVLHHKKLKFALQSKP